MNASATPPRPREWGVFTPLRDALARRIAGPEAESDGTPRFRCVIVKLDALGDFVLATGAIAQLLAHFGETRCALVVSPAASELARREFPRTACVVLPAHAQRLWRDFQPHRGAWRRALAELPTEHVVALRHPRSLYRDFVLRAVPARRRWWLADAPFGDRATLTLPATFLSYPADAAAPRELAAHAALIAEATGTRVEPGEILPRVSLPPTAAAPALVLAPCAQDPVRDLPAQIIAAALKEIPLPAALPLHVIGAASQRDRLEKFLAALPAALRTRGEILAGAPLEDWLAQLAGAELVLAADSASAHLAAALDRPLVALLGGGHPELFAPWQRSPRQRWLRHHIPCYGCDWQCPHPAPICLTDIEPAMIAAAMREVRAALP